MEETKDTNRITELLLKQMKLLSEQSENAYEQTIAPNSLAMLEIAKFLLR